MFYIMSFLEENAVFFDLVKEHCINELGSSFNENLFYEGLNILEQDGFLKIKNDFISMEYDADTIIVEISCLSLEIYGPLQLRDLSTFIKKNIRLEISITNIESIIKRARRVIIPYEASKLDYKHKITVYLLPIQIEHVGIRIGEYRDIRKRFELRRSLGILSDEDLVEGEKVIQRELKEQSKVNLDELVSIIMHTDTVDGTVEKVISLPPQRGLYSSPKKKIHDEIWKYFSERGIDVLYKHQSEAIDRILSNDDVVVSTSSASGKTFIYMIPILDILIDNPKATFLYIAPTKSLAQDQKNKFNELGNAILGKSIAENFDGHTTKEKREKILSDFPNIILTNEHMIHYTILPNHESWSRFLKNLQFVIIDELHWYRGVFGSHVANIFRRLNVVTAKYGSFPRFIGLSATIGNPKEFAEQLTSKTMAVISNDTSPKPEKKLVIWNSSAGEKSEFADAAEIISQHIAHQRTVLFFGRSRNMVEIMTRSVRDRLDPALKNKTASYRAGLTRDERKNIENDFFKGNIRGLNATSAMELGIDVGDLDSVILFGYPGSLSSFWQRANRAGRRDNFSLIFYVPRSNPLDQFFMNTPEELTRMDFENALINADNPKIVQQHLKCLVNEVGRGFLKQFSNQQAIDYFVNLRKFVEDALYQEEFEEEKAGLSFEPQWDVSLRSTSNDSIRIMYHGNLIAETDADRAPKELFEGAIYLAQGEKYLVKDLSFAEHKAEVVPYPTDEYTTVISSTDIAIEGFEKSLELVGRHVMLGKGKLNVKEYLIEFVRQDGSGTILQRGKLNFKPKSIFVDGLWILITQFFQSEHKDIDFRLALHGLVHLIINLTPIHSLCDINDVSGSFSMSHKNLQDNSGGFIYETNEYGVGLIDNIFSNFETLLKKSLSLIESCSCETGCPRCIHSQQCASENKDIDKRETIKLIKLILNDSTNKKIR
jgi:DEAD/DEAH box helicase domain-containing protein